MATDWMWCYENPKHAAETVDEVLAALAELFKYSRHHEGWQDDHEEIPRRVSEILLKHGKKPWSFRDDPDVPA